MIRRSACSPMPLILFLLSALVLTLEVLETKIFAYSLENSLIFLVVGVVLLGFGAGGSILATGKELGEPRRIVRLSLLAFAAMLVAAHAWFAQFSDHLQFRFDLWTVEILALLAAPYVAAGMAVSAILADPRGSVHKRYALNLAGSAAGCLTVFFVLGPLTAPQLLVVCALLAGLLAVPLFESRDRLWVLLGVLAVGIPCLLFADEMLPYRIQGASTGGQLALIERGAARVVETNPSVERLDVVQKYDRWDPAARVEVHSLDYVITDTALQQSVDQLPSMWFSQDSSYGSPLIGRGPAPEAAAGVYDHTCYGFGYFRGQPGMDVLVIGLGGTPDLQTALHHEAKQITGVDINATTVAMGRGPLAEFLGEPYKDDRITVHIRDGRSYVRGAEGRKWDLIQLSGVDTKSVLASGTLALNESYLYTQEAFDEYLAHLTDDGLLVVNYASEAFRLRMAATVLESLRRSGVEDPTRHVMMVSQSKIFGLLVSPSPFSAEDCAKMRDWLAAADANDGAPGDGLTGVVVWVYELLTPDLSLMNAPQAIYLPDEEEPADPIMAAARSGAATLDAFLDSNPLGTRLSPELHPAPDWRPFFFNIHRGEDILDSERRPAQFARAFRLLWIMLGMSLLLILGPLAVQGLRQSSVAARLVFGLALAAGLLATVHERLGHFELPFPFAGLVLALVAFAIPGRKGVGELGLWRTPLFALYFALLGAGYIMAMSGLIQRYVLFLGHQAYAFATVIGGLMVAAGIGATLAGVGKANPRRVMVIAVLVICSMLAALHYGIDPLFTLTADLERPARVGIGLAALLPLGIGLGAMFPTGLGMVQQHSPLFVPWAFGINGVFSVIGTSIVLPGAILYGFPTMTVAAGSVYVLALLVGLPLMRPVLRRSGGQ